MKKDSFDFHPAAPDSFGEISGAPPMPDNSAPARDAQQQARVDELADRRRARRWR